MELNWTNEEVSAYAAQFLQETFSNISAIAEKKSFVKFTSPEEFKSSRKQTVLFTTEDGVEVSDPEKEIYRLLRNGSWQTGTILAKHHPKMRMTPCSPKINPDWIHFSSWEKRDEYIRKNKPMISFADVSKAIRSIDKYREMGILYDLENALYHIVFKELRHHEK